MPSLIGELVAANYRKASPSTKFGTRELIHALITVANKDLTDSSTPDGNFAQAIQAIQTIGEVYAVGEATTGEGSSSFTVILSADTLADTNQAEAGNNFTDNSKATDLETVLNTLFGESITVTYTTMYGLAYN